jgi:hypothetical protein
MWDKRRSLLAVAATVGASVPWCGIAPGIFSLLGLAVVSIPGERGVSAPRFGESPGGGRPPLASLETTS